MAEDPGLRAAAMRWLDARPAERVDYTWLTTFEYEGRRVPLIDRQRGIRKPAGFDAALAIRTTFTPVGQTPPYADAIGSDGLQRYKYRGDDPNHPENIAIRRTMEERKPLIWFVGIASGSYEPIYPIWVVGDEPRNLQFALALDQAQRYLPVGPGLDEDARRYAERITKTRLHQRVFRGQVLLAYDRRCAVCMIKHSELLDAAHIIGDGQPGGEPVVPNGLSLCKIHHAAFDNRIVGVRPDYTLHVRQDILEEIDGWMSKGGIQAVHNQRLNVLPSSLAAQPDRVRLEQRYAEFVGS